MLQTRTLLGSELQEAAKPADCPATQAATRGPLTLPALRALRALPALRPALSQTGLPNHAYTGQAFTRNHRFGDVDYAAFHLQVPAGWPC